MEALYPEDQEGPEAREGTAAHHYVTEALLGRVWKAGDLAPNGHPLDKYMIENGERYLENVRAELLHADAKSLFRVETRVFAHNLVHPDNDGTPDTFLVDWARKLIILWDYKYGHRYVDPYKNWQFVNYIAGIFEGLGVTRADIADWRVSIRAIQPRNYSVEGAIRTWDTTGGEVWDLIETELRPAAWAAKCTDPVTTTGAHCRDCSARHACDALRRVGGYAMDLAGRAVPVELPPADLGRKLRHLRIARDRIAALLDSLEERAIFNIRRGQAVPGWTMGRSNSHWRFTTSPAETIAYGDLLGIDLREETKAKKPAAAKALLKLKGIDEAVISAITEKPMGEVRLIPVDENAAEKAFGQTPKGLATNGN